MANIKLLKKLQTRFLRMKHKRHFAMEPIAMVTDCGTAMCIAGHTLDLAGYKMLRKKDLMSPVFGVSGRQDVDFISPMGDVVEDVLDVAAKELGLDYDTEAHDLFHDFSLKTPKQAAKRIGKLIQEISA